MIDGWDFLLYTVPSLFSYFDRMKALLQDGYVPDEQDVLRSRVQTTGIIETSFKVKQLTYRSVNNLSPSPLLVIALIHTLLLLLLRSVNPH